MIWLIDFVTLLIYRTRALLLLLLLTLRYVLRFVCCSLIITIVLIVGCLRCFRLHCCCVVVGAFCVWRYCYCVIDCIIYVVITLLLIDCYVVCVITNNHSTFGWSRWVVGRFVSGFCHPAHHCRRPHPHFSPPHTTLAHHHTPHCLPRLLTAP